MAALSLDSDTDTENKGRVSENTGLLPSPPKHTVSAAVYASDGETPSQTYTGRVRILVTIINIHTSCATPLLVSRVYFKSIIIRYLIA